MNTPLVSVKFNSVLRVTDSFIRVRAKSGRVVTVPVEHTKDLKIKTMGGEGSLICPKHIALGVLGDA